MNKYSDLECSILSCLLLKPELMDKIILEEKHFVYYKRVWKFMKVFYKKYGNFDPNLMTVMCKDKYKIAQYIIMLLEYEPTALNFDLYQKQLIELYEESKKEQWLRNKVMDIANDFYLKNINSKEFLDKVNELYKGAEELFKNDD